MSKDEEMAKARSDLTWTEIDPTSLPDELRAQYQKYKEAYAAMKAFRQRFEGCLNDYINPPEGKRVVCGYNFGKLSIALADDDRKPAKAGAGSLADFLASAQASGRRV